MKKQTQAGFALVESMIAILIFSLGILTLIGLQSTAMRNTTQSQFRLEASLVADQRLGMIWANIPNMGGYAETDEAVSSLPDGRRTTTINKDTVRIVVSWTPPGESSRNTYTTVARVNTNKK